MRVVNDKKKNAFFPGLGSQKARFRGAGVSVEKWK